MRCGSDFSASENHTYRVVARSQTVLLGIYGCLGDGVFAQLEAGDKMRLVLRVYVSRGGGKGR